MKEGAGKRGRGDTNKVREGEELRQASMYTRVMTVVAISMDAQEKSGHTIL